MDVRIGCHGGLENSPPWLAVKNVLDEKKRRDDYFYFKVNEFFMALLYCKRGKWHAGLGRV